MKVMGFHSAVPRLKASILRGVPFPLPCSSVDSFSRLPFLQLQPFGETKLRIFIAAISATEASPILKAQQQPRPLRVTVLGVINSVSVTSNCFSSAGSSEVLVGFLSNISRDFEVVGGVSSFDSPVVSLSCFFARSPWTGMEGVFLCVFFLTLVCGVLCECPMRATQADGRTCVLSHAATDLFYHGLLPSVEK